jgi:hypothetical protein
LPPTACESDSPLTANVRYGYALGWSFTPLDGKRPVLKGWQSASRESLEQALAWASKGNVGLRTGKASGIVVIDVDPGGNIAPLGLPGTVTAMSGRPGAFHLYFRHNGPLRNTSKKLGPHIDVKADGGQVVFPGSVHPDTGAVYAWAEGREPWNVELAELPAHIVELLQSPDSLKQAAAGPALPAALETPTEPDSRPSAPERAPKSRADAKAARYAQRALRLELHALTSAANGTRNDTLNRAAFSMGRLIGGGYLARAEVEAALRSAAESVGLEPREIDATLRSGLDAGMREPRTIEFQPRPRCEGESDFDPAEYVLLPGPHKDDQDAHIEQSSVDFASEVLGRLPADAIYRRDFIPGEVIGEAGRRKWVELSADRMRIVVDSHAKLAKWVTHRQTKEQVLLYQACNKDAAGLVLAHATGAAGIRELHLMVSYPVYGPGFVRVEPGWHDGLYYDEPDELRDLRPETDCAVIHNVLHDLVVDFPFKGEADRQNFFGLLLTPIIAPALDGNRPMHLLNAPLERTGKSKLVNEVFGGIITGRDTPSMQITDREEEREKRILAMLLQGETLMHLDNLPAYIDSPALASLLTTQRFLGRLLGYSRNVSLPNNLTIVGTGNNVQASGEIAKRIVPIVIEPASANPEARTDFQHPDIRAYVRQQRRAVLECLLGLVENWLAAGRPRHKNRLGGFENWSEVVGGILQVNGLRAWRTNEGDWRKVANPHGAELESLVQTWHEVFGCAEVTPKELRGLAEREELFGHLFAKQNSAATSVAFGRMLSRNVDKPVGSWFIRRVGASNHAKYHLEDIL